MNQFGRSTIFAASFIVFLSGSSTLEPYIAGENTYGQLGTADTTAQSASPQVASPWVMLDAGFRHTCGITAANTLWCWGRNSRGEVGVGSTASSIFEPTQVGIATGWQSVSAGFRHTCGILWGELWCWGSDQFGQLGNGNATTANQNAPVRVGTFADWTQVYAGHVHTCGIRVEDGFNKLYCWGNNTYGQVGDGTTIDVDAPVRIFGPGGVQWSTVAAGKQHTCALTDAGEVYCWGRNSLGQLGTVLYSIGSVWDFPLYPVAKGGDIVRYVSLSAGGDFNCALGEVSNSDSTDAYVPFCWGDNGDEQILSPVEEYPYFDTPINTASIALGIPSSYENHYSTLSVGLRHWCGIRVGVWASPGSVTVVPVAPNLVCLGSDAFNERAIEDVSIPEPEKVSSGGFHTAVLSLVPFVDTDGDGIQDTEDNCPNQPNPGQNDFNSNGIGDACEDTDGDGILDAEDNCRSIANPLQEDANNDGCGDACITAGCGGPVCVNT